MRLKKKLIISILLLVLCLLIHWYTLDPVRVEKGYSTNIYPAISVFLRTMFGFIPFSIGDLLYGAAVIFLAVKLFQVLRFIFSRQRRKNGKEKIPGAMLSFCNGLFLIYIIFNIFWGINYNRQGIALQIGLTIQDYTVEDLKAINAVLVEKVNSSKAALVKQNKKYPDDRQLFNEVAAAYKNLSKKYLFLRYDHPSVKTSLFGWFGNYTGFSGYYNPFTGEAQVNTTGPKYTHPYTACHEAAHGLGYAKEMEANFAGYLAAAASDDTLFHYSVYSDLFLYANRSLYFADTAAAATYRKQVSPAVMADYKARSKFNREHASFMEPIARLLYGKYLQSNQQPKGMWSYDEVTAFIISYYKKFGTI